MLFSYEVSDHVLRDILDNDILLNEKLTDYKTWFNFTVCCKALNKLCLWWEYSKTAYGKKYTQAINENNSKIYDNINESQYNTAFSVFFTPENLKLIKFMNIKPNIIKPSQHIETGRYVQDMSKPSIYECDHKNVFVMSDTGTGKTASFVHYIKSNPDLNFISLTLRTSLCDDQYKNMSEAGLTVKNYQIQPRFNAGDNIICQLDSINMINLKKIDIENYVLFLDETDGLLSYMTMSPTLKKTLYPVFKKLCMILKRCKKVICCDKLMSDAAINFINHMTGETDYEFYLNTYKNWQGVYVNIWDNEEALIKDANESNARGEGYFIGVDERRQQNALHGILDDPETATFINKASKNIDLNYKRIIVTPKITEGVDIQPDEPINTYAFYQTTTINARTMYQQLTRNRKPKSMNICFLSNRCMSTDKETDKAIYEDYDELDSGTFNIFNDIATHEETNLFLSLRCHYEFNDRAYKTNPKKHLLNMMRQAGFIISDTLNETKPMTSCNDKSKNNKDTMLCAMTTHNTLQTPEYNRVNEILKLPIDVATKNVELYASQSALNQHFNMCKYMNKTDHDIKNDIDELETFKVLKLIGNENGILSLKTIIKICGGVQSLNDINEITQDGYDEINKIINSIKTRSTKTHDIRDVVSMRTYISKIFKSLFGADSLEKTGVLRIRQQVKGETVKNKTISLYDYNFEFLKNVKFIESFRISKSDEVNTVTTQD
jgi:hypothetical protein